MYMYIYMEKHKYIYIDTMRTLMEMSCPSVYICMHI